MNSRQDDSITKVLVLISLAKVIFHVATSQGYGYFRDEFYYIACSEHLAAGYVDQPPLSIFLLWLSRSILGDSLFAIRFLPAVAGGLTIWFTGKIARELGSSTFGVILSTLAVFAVPSYLGNNHYYSMNSFDILCWTAGTFVFLRILKEGKPRDWILLGIILGLGLLNKISVLWFGAGIFVGLLLSPSRKYFLTPWPWIAGLIAVILFSPYVIWQMQNDWPTLEFMRNATQDKMATTPPMQFMLGQIDEMNPFLLPIWLIGLLFYFVLPGGRRYRACGWIYITVFAILILNQKSRPGYLGPAYPMLFAAGATTIADWIDAFRVHWLKPVIAAIVIVAGIVVVPFAVPVLPVESYIAYAKKMGVAPSTEENKEIGELPQFYADMFGWDAHITELTRIWNQFSPEDQKRCKIFGSNYGQAGAINFLGRKHGLPAAISSHNNYWLWGPGDFTGECLITMGGSAEQKKRFFENAEPVGKIDCKYCMPYEDNKVVYLCRHVKGPVNEVWKQIKHYD
ncbi:MAG TPA: glycosyltransferase family 39 protein [Acidobacteriota bacterium]|nr:glycosyltransferase family 39 protein [Acidobacteriota bacterium]